MQLNKISKVWKEYRSLILFLVLMSVFRSAVADWNTVPTGSMLPTIVQGDRILIDKLAYDVRLPFSPISLHKLADPRRGDIVVFDSKVSDIRLVKRVVGIPGDKIAMNNNVLVINGQPLHYETQYSNESGLNAIEQLGDIKHWVRFEAQSSQFSSFESVRVPEDHYLVLGDNRDNSADSRFIGFVPREEIIGKAGYVVMSLNYDNFYLPRPSRFFKPLDAS